MNITKALVSMRESTHLEFKEKFDIDQTEDWCDLIKHIAAIANSGGGIILIGINNDGSPSTQDITAVLGLDPAKFTDKIAKYTGVQYDGLRVFESIKQGHRIAVLEVQESQIPLVFVQPGTYATGDGKQKSSFSLGTIYFRHGAKSEPACFDDLRNSFERELKRVRISWLGNIRQIVHAPVGTKMQYLGGDVTESKSPNAQLIRVVDESQNPDAPVYRKVWDDSPYESAQEILIGVLKSWKHDNSSYPSETDIWSLYTERNALVFDDEKALCLLLSAIHRHAPIFFFAKSLSRGRLIETVKKVIVEDKYPAPNFAAKLAHAFGGELGMQFLDEIINNSNYISARACATKLKQSVLQPDRIRITHGLTLRIGEQSYNIEKAKVAELEKFMVEALNSNDKAAVKYLDVLLYAPKLAD